MKGGFGLAAANGAGARVAALAVVNALGDVRGADGTIIAGARNADGSFVDSARIVASGALARPIGDIAPPNDLAGQNTTLAVVAADVSLTRLALAALARTASAALYRRITPTGTSLDGDIVFAVCPHDARSVPTVAPQIEWLAVTALESAIERAVREATGRDGIPGLADGARTRSTQSSSGRT
jgi:L-aminopeptidase/D-esterase-like protein